MAVKEEHDIKFLQTMEKSPYFYDYTIPNYLKRDVPVNFPNKVGV
jgi:hypothetical protein